VARNFLSLGSNLGDRAEHLREGVRIVTGSDPYRVSSLYETEPVGGVVQDDFWNIVIELQCSDTPQQLLERCQRAEQARERVRDLRWGPRTLDVDVLLMEGITSSDPAIQVPHPRMYERAFVLVPLSEVAPELVSPSQLAAASGAVRRIGTLF
jgi:2-amino-4-hydroxy-6-hydroxymethyldihydropteridine diphosphokinase